MNLSSPMNGHDISPDTLEFSLSTLKSIASTGQVDVEWSILKQAIRTRLHQNVQMYLASSTQIGAQLEPSPFPKSSPVVPFPEEADKDDTSGSSTDATSSSTDVSMNSSESLEGAAKNGLTGKGLNDVSLSERLGPIDVIGGRTLPGRVNAEEAEFMVSRVWRLLDDFESDPPFTIQRLCEILVDPQSIHSSLGKHIRAIERTLLVTSSFRPPSPSDNNTIPTFSTKPMPSTVPGLPVSPRNSSAPLFSPIPFLALQTPPPQPSDPLSSSTGLDESNETVTAQPMSPLSLEPKPDHEMSGPDQLSVETSRPSMLPDPVSGPTPSTSSGLIEPDELRVDELDAGVIPDSLPLASPPLSAAPSKPTLSSTSTSEHSPISSASTPSSSSIKPASASDVVLEGKTDQDATVGGGPLSAGPTANHRHFLANRPVALSSTTSIPDGPLLTGSASSLALGPVLDEGSANARPVRDDDREGQAEETKRAKLDESARTDDSAEDAEGEKNDREEERFERSASPAVDPLRIRLTEGEEVKQV